MCQAARGLQPPPLDFSRVSTPVSVGFHRHLRAAGVPGFNCEATEAIGALLLYSPKAMRSFRTAVFFGHFSVID